MTEIERLLPVLNEWAHGTGATIYLYGSRVHGDHHRDSDVDLFIDWPKELSDHFADWWTKVNSDGFCSISQRLGAKAGILDPDDKPMHAKIRAAKIISVCGCAVAVLLPRVKPPMPSEKISMNSNFLRSLMPIVAITATVANGPTLAARPLHPPLPLLQKHLFLRSLGLWLLCIA